MAMTPLKDAVVPAGCSVKTLKRLIKKHELRHDRLGPRKGFRIEPLEAVELRARLAAERRCQTPTAPPATLEPEPEQPEPLEVGPSSPPAPQPEARPRRRRGSEAPPPQQSAPAQPVTEQPMAEDLLRVVQLSRVLQDTQSLAITRVPTADTDPGFWGKNKVKPIVGITKRRLQDAIRSGGVKPLLLKLLGPGTYRVEWIGPGGVLLHAEEITIPNLEQEAVRLELEQERQRELQGQARRDARDRRRQEREERRQRREDLRLAAEQAAWARDVAALVMREVVRRVRWAQARVLSTLQGAAEAGSRQAASYSRQAARLRREGWSLQLQAERLLRVRMAQDGGSLRRRPELPDLEEQGAPPPPLPPPPLPPPTVWHQPLAEELERIRSTDLGSLHSQVLEQLEERAGDLFPAPLLNPRVIDAVEHLLPQVLGEFVPWLAIELFPPPPPPPPLPWVNPGHGPWAPPTRTWDVRHKANGPGPLRRGAPCPPAGMSWRGCR